MTYAVLIDKGGYKVTGKVLAYDPETGTLSYEFMGVHHLCSTSKVHRVRSTMTEIAMSTNQEDAVERVREALNEFRRNRNAAMAGAPKPPRNRYASIGAEDSPAPSPAKVVPAEKRAPVVASSKKIELPALARPAQRLSNGKVELFYPVDTIVKAKLPNGKLELCVTEKAFGKAYKLA